MPGLPLLFTGTGGVTEFNYHPLPGLYLGEDTFLGEGIWLDEGVSEAFGKQPFLAFEGMVEFVTPTPAVAIQTTVTLPVIGDVIEIVTPVPALAFGGTIGEAGVDVVIHLGSPVPAVAFMPVPGTSGAIQTILVPSVRELPPLRLSHLIETPTGRFFRWAGDEPNPINIPSGERFSDTMPGGFENADCTLPRKPKIEYSDLEPLSTWKIYAAGGESVWEGRIERAPRVSGGQAAISPSAVGFQAHLDDNKSVRELIVDRDMSRWGSMSRSRDLLLRGSTPKYDPSSWSASVQPDDTTGIPAVAHTIDEINQPNVTAGVQIAESWYHANGVPIGALAYNFRSFNMGGGGDTAWTNQSRLYLDDVGATTADASGDHDGALGPVGVFLVAGGGGRKYASLLSFYNANYTGGPQPGGWAAYWSDVAVYGQQGMPGTTPDGGGPPGFKASVVVNYVVRKWAPQLTTQVQESGFVIPHLTFLDPTTTSEIVKQASRFGLQDWAVWDNKTFWWHDRGARGNHWRTRVGPAQLEEAGPQIDRIYESVVVQYQDVDGTAKTVGPPGSGADVESASLKDPDPENPANAVGIIRRAFLSMGTTSARGAIEIGRRFLEEQKQLDSSGRARIVGHVENDRGVVYPYSMVRAGDTLAFVDAADTSPRRIVRTEKDHASRTCSVDLDAPPEGLQALLERLGVALVPLGLN